MTLRTLLWSTVILYILVFFVADIWNEKRILGYKSKKEKIYFYIIAIVVVISFIYCMVLLSKRFLI